MKLIAIAAVSLDGVIGIDDRIPWRIPEDFKHFRDTTMGGVLLVGKTTYLTLPKKAHEGREYVVLNGGDAIPDLDINDFQFSSIDTILYLLSSENTTLDKVFVIGGASIYEQMIDYCDEAIITFVDKLIPEGNKRFPLMKLLEEFECTNTANWETSKTGEQYKIRYYKRRYGGKGETEAE
jgi:dihydrofolate reductase